MRLYGAIQKVEPLDDGTVCVHGIATSEAVDDQGEVVRADAIRAAIPEYMRFPALREMHQLTAAGTTLEAEVGNDGTTRIVAHVVDPIAVTKVKSQVYRGFSIGGRVTQRDPRNPKAITGLVLNEISLVDRPANPEAVFDCWKASAAADAHLGGPDHLKLMTEPTKSAQLLPAQEPFSAPIQIWACGVFDHRHRAKADAAKCLEGQSAAATTESARRETRAMAIGDDEASCAAVSEGVSDGSYAAQVIINLDWLEDRLQVQAEMESGDSPRLKRLQAIVRELRAFLNALVAEEVGEPPSDATMDGAPPPIASEVLTMATSASRSTRGSSLQRPRSQDMHKLTAAVLKKRQPADRALVDMAYRACDKCLEITDLSAEETERIDKARDHLREASSALIDDASDDTRGPEEPVMARGVDPRLFETITEALGGRGCAHQHLMDIAHDCISTMSEGLTCKEAARVSANLSREMIDHLVAAHGHLVAAGAQCDAALPCAASAEASDKDDALASAKSMPSSDLLKALADERAEKTALARTLGDVVPMLEHLTKRVEDIARTPLPPLTMAKGTISVSKHQDGGNGSAGEAELSPDAVAAALSKMTREEQTLALIKASYANPIRMHGSDGGER
jgi:hypothetical protein